MKALALFSGGLDSALAIKVLQQQGIEVIALNFVSHFFGGKNEKADSMAEQLGVKLEYIDFKRDHTEVLKNPANGRGKNINPCIDCHALMFQQAIELLDKYEASFIISGEVLGQRPMSQNYKALQQVEEIAGSTGLILRPLSAKNLPITIPEEKGWVDRERLCSIQGRSRKPQIALAKELGLVEYPSPGGGCLLTESSYSNKLLLLEREGFLEEEHSLLFYLMKYGRFFHLGKGRYIFVGRHNEENVELRKYTEDVDLYIRGLDTPGPVLLGVGEFTEAEIAFGMKLFSRYSKAKGEKPAKLSVNGSEAFIEAFDVKEFEQEIQKFQFVD